MTPGPVRSKDARQRRLDKGLCINSGLHGPYVTGHKRCQSCLDKHRLASKRSRASVNEGKPPIRAYDDVGWGQYRVRMTPPVPYEKQQCTTSAQTEIEL